MIGAFGGKLVVFTSEVKEDTLVNAFTLRNPFSYFSRDY
jgi:hypothetical protein